MTYITLTTKERELIKNGLMNYAIGINKENSELFESLARKVVKKVRS